MSRKTGALFVLWFLATVGAVSLSRFAMGIVADEVASTSVAPLSQAAVSEALDAADATSSTSEPGEEPASAPSTSAPLAASPTTKPQVATGPLTTSTSSPSTSSSSSTSSSTTTTTTPVTSTTETRSGAGGSVTVRFSCGTTVELLSASPNPGYSTDIEHAGPQEVDVRFEKTDGDGETRIRAKCENGQPSWRVEEDDD